VEIASLLSTGADVVHYPLETERRAMGRRERRTESSFLRVLDALLARTGLTTRKRAATAVRVALGTLCQELPAPAAQRLRNRLPLYLRELLKDDLSGAPLRALHARVVRHLMQDLELHANEAGAVLTAVREVFGSSKHSPDGRPAGHRLPAEQRYAC
jgi:uncharacterized protein (DUF2267 family)